MKKAYYAIFETYRSGAECERELNDALGNIASRSEQARVIEIDPEVLESSLEKVADK